MHNISFNSNGTLAVCIYVAHVGLKKKYRERNSETKLSFLLLPASAVSRYSKQLPLSYSLFCSCQYYQQKSDAGAIRIWILKDFFVRFSHFLDRHFFIRPTNSSTLGFFTLHTIQLTTPV
jgi:hypothetical protein